jgi:hypothetical protein
MVHPYPCIGFIASTILLQNRATSPALIRVPETGSRIGCCRASHYACFQRARCRQAVQIRPMGTVSPRLRLRANRKCKRDCDDECSPHFSLPRVSTVESSLDGKPAR